MKKLIVGTVLTTAFISGCAVTTDEHLYVNGDCMTCFNNPLTGEPINYEQKEVVSQQTDASKQKVAVEHECGPNWYDQIRDPRDQRWCGGLTLPGGSFSDVINYEEVVNVAVDLAYARAKRHLDFKAPYDPENPQYNSNTSKWDGIAGTYYGIKAIYGGPGSNLLWYSRYDLQLEKVDSNNTKVKLEYRIYGQDSKPKGFHTRVLNNIKDV